MDNKKIVFVVGGLLLIVLIFFGILSIGKEEGSNTQTPERNIIEKIKEKITGIPTCPKNLSGILTYPLMDPQYIAALTPLGNINPPGHTSPVDHIYFQTNYDGHIPMSAPADSVITQVITISKEKTPGKYEVEGYVIRYEVCDGLELDFANYNDVVDSIKAELIKQGERDCKRGIVKDGHGGIAEGQCYYNVHIPVKSGEQVGWVWQVPHPEGFGMTLPFEIWAANYNVEPPSQTNWEFYNDNRYAHIMCPFDLYTGDLKNEFYKKFGRWEYEVVDANGKKIVDQNSPGRFVPRNGDPLCGQVDQDIIGTIQGMWFSEKTPENDDNVKFNGGLAFLHDNVDVTQAEISVGGNLTNNTPGVVLFAPTHSGLINREPSEVKSDGNIYCYNAEERFGSQGKFLVQLISDRTLKTEFQAGTCGTTELFSKPFLYQR